MIKERTGEHKLVVAFVRNGDLVCGGIDRELRILVELVYVRIGRSALFLVVMSGPIAVDEFVICCGLRPVLKAHRFDRLGVIQPPAVAVTDIGILVVRVEHVGYGYRHRTVVDTRVVECKRKVAAEQINASGPRPARAV